MGQVDEEHVNNLQNDLVVLLMGFQQFDETGHDVGLAEQFGAPLVGSGGAQQHDHLQHQLRIRVVAADHVLDPLDHVEVAEYLGPVQVGQVQVAQNADALAHKVLLFGVDHSFRYVTDELLKNYPVTLFSLKKC